MSKDLSAGYSKKEGNASKKAPQMYHFCKKKVKKKQNYGSERYRNLHDNEKGKKSENMTVNSTTIFQCLAKFWIFFQANV